MRFFRLAAAPGDDEQVAEAAKRFAARRTFIQGAEGRLELLEDLAPRVFRERAKDVIARVVDELTRAEERVALLERGGPLEFSVKVPSAASLVRRGGALSVDPHVTSQG